VRYANGQVAAWLQRRRGTLADAERSCVERLKVVAGVGIGRRADVDLNTYRIVTVNTDRTVAFINPFVGLNNAKLESIVELPGDAIAWLHLPERTQLWVRLAGPDRLVLIDTYRRRIVRSLPMPAGGTADAADLAYDGPGARLWVALPAAGRLATLDLRAPAAEWQLVEVPGVHGVQVIDAGDGAAQVMSLHDGGEVLRWVGMTPQAGTRWTLQTARVRQLTYSPLARATLAHDGRRLWLLAEPDTARPITVDHAIDQVGLVDDGRYAVVTGGGRMSFIDLATGRTVARSGAVASTRAIQHTDGFVYAIAGDAASANLWSLSALREGRAEPIQVMLGSAAAPSAVTSTSFEMAVPSPTGTGLLVANAADALIYQYAEGMMAPVGSYSNYRREPLAVTVLDMAPREVGPGRYEAIVRHEDGGRHDLIVSGIGPRFAGCDLVSLPDAGAATSTPLAPLPTASLMAVHPLQGLRFRVTASLRRSAGGTPGTADADHAAAAVIGADDLVLMLFDRRTGWQARVPLHATAAGAYEAEVGVPRAATYDAFVSSVALAMTPLQGRLGRIDFGGQR